MTANDRRNQAVTIREARERVVLVGLARSQGEIPAEESSLEELALLADTAGAEPVDRIIQVKQTPDPATYIGKGKAREVVERARALNASAIIFDDELAPAQGRNLEDLAGVNPLDPGALKIIDRTGLILDVFAQHAQSAEGKLQVELAQINYLVPRLRGWGEVMSRLGGGIGTRGPGETKLEVDRRRINRRLRKLRGDLKDLERTRQIKRQKREKSGVVQISLVGYTNSGKSTLLNALTGAGVLVEDRLFSTLDPTVRRVTLSDGREAVLTDTVGFVRKLPHQLVEAFRSTLEETVRADLLLHVVDASSADPLVMIEAVNRVLVEIGAESLPMVIALNKCDLLPAGERDKVATRFPEGILISAATSEGLDALLDKISRRISAGATVAAFVVPHDRGDVRSILHDEGEVIEENFGPEGIRMVARISPSMMSRFSEFLVVQEPV